MISTVDVARTAPRHLGALGVPVATTGALPRSLGWTRAALAASGFEGKAGQTLVVPTATGPTVVMVGIGEPGSVSAASLRTAAAALVRAVPRATTVATALADVADLDAREAARPWPKAPCRPATGTASTPAPAGPPKRPRTSSTPCRWA